MHSPSVRWVPYDSLAERQRSSGAVRTIWAQHDPDAVLVFQAYRPEIGRAAVAAGTLAVPGFGLSRATWLKPGFLWMMRRSDWGRAEGQQVVLGIFVARAWFEEALGRAVLSSERRSAEIGAGRPPSDVVVQWDPDWDPSGHRQPWRAIQIGLLPSAVPGYLAAITGITDLSEPIARGRDQLNSRGGPDVPDADIVAIADQATRRRLGIDEQ